MTYLITSLDKNWKLAVYTGVNIHRLYHYLEIIVHPTILTASVQISHHFGPSSSTKNDTTTLQSVIVDLHVIQNIICKWCLRIGQKAYDCIICGHKLLPPNIRRKMNQLNALHGDKKNDPPIEWNCQHPSAHFKFNTFTPKTSPVV